MKKIEYFFPWTLFSTSQKSRVQIQTFCKEKILSFWVKTHSIYIAINNHYCRTDIDEARVISFLEVRTEGQTNGWTDTILESS